MERQQGIGALNGWTMIYAEMPLAAAGDGLFPGPVQVFLAGGALLLGIPVNLAQRRHLTPPEPVPPYR